MEDRSSERVRTLVTKWPDRGLSANQNARALISMMARSTTRSNLRPDTLMQDRHRQFDEIFLQRTAGPYIWVKAGKAHCEDMFSALPLSADIAQRSRHIRFVPISEIIRSPHRRGRAASLAFPGRALSQS